MIRHLILAPTALALAVVTVTATDIGTPAGADQSFALDVNAAGEVAGYAVVGGVNRAQRWTESGGFSLIAGVSGASLLNGINDAGVAVGSAQVAGFTRAIRWHPAGQVDTLSAVSPNPFDVAQDINASGTVAGAARYLVSTGPSVYQVHATIWTGSTGSRIFIPSAVNSQAIAINTAGATAGVSLDAAGATRAFYFDGVALTLIAPPAGYTQSVATGINDAGVVVGYIRNAAATDTRVFTWTLAGGLTVLPLAATPTYAIAYDVNASGDVAGAIRADNGAFHAAVFRAGAWIDLEAGDVSTSVAQAINSAGVLVGYRSTPLNRARRWTATSVAPNTAPSITGIQLPVAPIAAGSAVTLTATFNDVDLSDSHTATVDWGFGPELAIVTGSTISATRVFAEPGVFSARVRVVDAAGAEDVRSSTLDVPAYVVVYSATEGFVTGGGWIPLSASDCPALCSGPERASFGLVSKYESGSAIPSGNTQLNIQGGGLRFRSTEMQWLVVADGVARYAGIGEVDGQAGYSFLVVASQAKAGVPAGLRIRIVNSASGLVVLDSEPEAGELENTVTPLGGGTIRIHTR